MVGTPVVEVRPAAMEVSRDSVQSSVRVADSMASLVFAVMVFLLVVGWCKLTI